MLRSKQASERDAAVFRQKPAPRPRTQPRTQPTRRRLALANLGRTAAALLFAGMAGEAHADKIANPNATFEGLDKITGRVISFDVAIGETVQFGSLQLTARVCYSRPPTESPNSTSFIEVNDVTFNNEYRRIFTGWVFASSPGLHAVEHPIYDVWLIDCKGGKDIIAEAKEEEVAIEPELKGSLTKPGEKPVTPPGGQPPKPGTPGGPAVAARTPGRIAPRPAPGVPVQPPQERPSRSFFSIFSGGGSGGGGSGGGPLPITPRGEGGNR
jgi:hypothetical protein